MTEEQSSGAVVPRQPQGPLEQRSRLLSRGRELALDLLRPVKLVTRWSDLGIKSIRWAAANPRRWESAVCGIVEPRDDPTLVWGSPDRHTLRTGSWTLGNVPAGPLDGWLRARCASESMRRYPLPFTPNGCAALSCGSQLAMEIWTNKQDSFVAIMPIVAGGPKEPDLRVILRTSYADPPRSMDFSPDGSRLAVGTLNGTVRVLDVSTGTEVLCIGSVLDGAGEGGEYVNAARYLPEGGHWKRVNAVQYHPAGHAVLSGSRDGNASLWDDATGRELTRYVHGADIRAVAFAREGTVALTAGTDSFIRCWDVQGGNELTRIPSATSVEALAVSPLNRWVAWGASSGEVGVWDLERSRECGRIVLDPAEVSSREVVAIRFLDSKRFVALFASGALLRVRIRAGGRLAD